MEIRDNEDSAIKLLEENVELKNTIKRLEQKIKEVRKYIDKNELFSADTYYFSKEILEILDKVE